MKHIETIDLGDHVECDGCSKDFTGSPETGGILFGSKGYGPCCSDKLEADAKRFGEAEYIGGRCPSSMSFAAWVLSVINGDNTFIIYMDSPE